MATLREPLQRLVDSSRRTFRNPYESIDWPVSVDPTADWFTAPELTTVHGTPLWDVIGDGARRRLAFLEALNFYSLNIHGERDLMEGLVTRLYRPDLSDAASYLHHFIDEENKHSVHFGTFCTRYGRVYRSRQPPGAAAPATPDADLRFFAKVLVFEEIIDRFNVAQAKDERLHPIARFINQSHHAEEVRHLAFGRRVVAELWRAHRASWSSAQIDDLRRYLAQFFVTTWRQFFNPDVYRDAGFDDPWDVAERLWASEAQRELRRAFSKRIVEFLTVHEILLEDPHAAY